MPELAVPCPTSSRFINKYEQRGKIIWRLPSG
jgi:hypothetical protein